MELRFHMINVEVEIIFLDLAQLYDHRKSQRDIASAIIVHFPLLQNLLYDGLIAIISTKYRLWI